MSNLKDGTIVCKAAVCWAVGEDLKIEEIEVEAPKKDEIRAKIVASGVVSAKKCLKFKKNFTSKFF
jgi:S-(hydroxymethyl)glutathione dehydrogenase/alcohol dehydrogenase